jgi:arylsulfatase A-like enzyme
MIIFIVDAEFTITMSRNIVFIYLDSVRKDYFDVYASRLSAMADTTFEQCRAPSGWSLPNYASLLTGTLPHEHGVSPKVNQTFEALASVMLS